MAPFSKLKYIDKMILDDLFRSKGAQSVYMSEVTTQKNLQVTEGILDIGPNSTLVGNSNDPPRKYCRPSLFKDQQDLYLNISEPNFSSIWYFESWMTFHVL